MKVKDSNKEKTAFITKYGSFQFNRIGTLQSTKYFLKSDESGVTGATLE